MSGPDDSEGGDLSGGDLSGDIGAIIMSFLILLAAIVMTFGVYYVLLEVS
jgi:hypothetical protein